MKTRNRIAAVLAALSLTVGAVLAAPITTDTVTLDLSGTVEALRDLSISTVAGYNSLDLDADATDTDVANVTELSNLGYKVTVASTTAGTGSVAYLSSATTSQKLAYTIKYGTQAVSLTSGVGTITTSATKTVAAGVTKLVEISWVGRVDHQGALLSPATDYNDTLTFTIAAP